MTKIIHITEPQGIENHLNEFKTDLMQGFKKSPKKIKSKYFYDKKGSNLFNKITKHPDYYITACEIEILSKFSDQITNICTKSEVNLIEFGPGEGVKTELLLDSFLKKGKKIRYIPIDISVDYLEKIARRLDKYKNDIDILPIQGDFLEALKWTKLNEQSFNMVLFLGSSIGNYSMSEALLFLNSLHKYLYPQDAILIGFDLRKSINKLMKAYNDRDGITREFNLNLLERINRELNADFNIDKFVHHSVFNSKISAMESFLVSLENQIVTIKELDKSFKFAKDEKIHVEYSYKYHLGQIKKIADDSNFKIVNNYFDSKSYFVDSLWQIS